MIYFNVSRGSGIYRFVRNHRGWWLFHQGVLVESSEPTAKPITLPVPSPIWTGRRR